MFARVNDIELYYEVHGEGEPVLLIPGLGSDSVPPASGWMLRFVPPASGGHFL